MLLVTIPHSGEKVPVEANWLAGLPETVLMCDVDRYVDRLYEATLKKLAIPWIKTEWHRYVADLNRIPDDIDCDSVLGSHHPQGRFSRGFHWSVTTQNDRLMNQPMPRELHDKLVQLIYEPFHAEVRALSERLKKEGAKELYHIDAHSMPSRGTVMHRDPGQWRAEIVISDCQGKSCSKKFRDLVIAAYVIAGFRVGYNWPYLGGRLTEQYGHPESGHHAIQVELNRSLYMNEESKQWNAQNAKEIELKIANALAYIQRELKGFV